MLWLALMFGVSAVQLYMRGADVIHALREAQGYSGARFRLAVEMGGAQVLALVGIIMLARRDKRGLYVFATGLGLAALARPWFEQTAIPAVNIPIAGWVAVAAVGAVNLLCVFVTHAMVIRSNVVWSGPKGDEVRERGKRILCAVAYKLGPTARVWLALLAAVVLWRLSDTITVAADNISQGVGSWREGSLLLLILSKILAIGGLMLMWRARKAGAYIFGGATIWAMMLLYVLILPEIKAAQPDVRHALEHYAFKIETAAQLGVLLITLALTRRLE